MDCANGFVNIFSVHNDLNATNNFIRFLNFTYSFVEVNVDVSYDGNHNLSELMNTLKPGSKGYFSISVFDKFNFAFANKAKT